MVAIPTFTRLTVPLATAVAAVGGGLAALTFLVMPTSLLERLVARAGFRRSSRRPNRRSA